MLPLRGASDEQIADTLADANATLLRMLGKASALSTFETAARKLGVESHLNNYHDDLIEFAVKHGIMKAGGMKAGERAAMVAKVTEQSLANTELAVKISTAVILHTTVEDYFMALCRVGAATNRTRAVKWIENRRFAVSEMSARSTEDLVDLAIEEWLKKLTRDTVLDKWDRLVGLFGYPSELVDLANNWRFDRDTLEEFDTARHDGVHSSGTVLRTFDVDAFKVQLQRAALVLLVHVVIKVGVKLNAARMFLGPDWIKAISQPESKPA